jgi:hypothetical protein
VAWTEARAELGHLSVQDLCRADTDLTIGVEEPLELADPRLAVRDGRDGPLAGVARDLARVREEVGDGRRIERLERVSVGVEELVDVVSLRCCQRQSAEYARLTVRARGSRASALGDRVPDARVGS